MSKVLTMRQVIADFVPDGASVALGLQMEQMIPFAAGHELIRQKKRNSRRETSCLRGANRLPVLIERLPKSP